MSNEFKPVAQRLVHLDVLRGFALLGILLVNFEWFARPLQAIVLGPETGPTGLDTAATWLIQVLGEGKFYPLFSMLFGAGFALMAERALSRQTPFWGVYLRRLLVLALFGLAHAVLVWAGDILLVYSLTAFVMVLLFRKTPSRRLWKWALPIIFLPVVLAWLGTAAIEASRLDPATHAELMQDFKADQQAHRQVVERAAAVHAEGSWRDNVAQRLEDLRFTLGHFLFWVPPVLGYFLIGRWLVVTGRLTRPEDHRLWFRRWRARGLVLGLPLAVLAAALLHGTDRMVPTPAMAAALTFLVAGGLLLSLAYLSMVTLSAQRLKFLAPAGQMALTNYLAQSIFWTWMLYGHGIGLWGQLPRAWQLGLGLIFFAVQVVASHFWLRHFRYGPAEWLWRSLTYWHRQPLLRRRGPTNPVAD